MNTIDKDYKAPVGEGIYKINTGDWRTQYPTIIEDICISCGKCLMYCPVNSIRKDGKRFYVDLSYCKGCGVCAHECSVNAIEFKREEKK
jgi:2-oxoacid:acceptor oxidoreductase delta subunit (pyruvate/2-ketoisovalerate family)